MPGQIALLPWAFVLGHLHLSNSIDGLILVHCVQGLSFTTLFCRNYYVNIPDDLIKAARIDGAGFWRIFYKIVLPLSPPILIVTVIWQFTGIWNEYLFGVVFTGGTQQPITAALVALATGQMNARRLRCHERRGADRRDSAAADLFLRRQIFRARPDAGRDQMTDAGMASLTHLASCASASARSRCSRASISRRGPANSSRWSAPQAAASRPCSR